jgi:hypothetical protein
LTVVDLEEAPSWIDRLSPRIQKAALDGLYLAGLRGVGVIVSSIIPSRSPQPVDRGIYRAGWGAASVRRVGNKSVELTNSEPHAVFIEEGVRAQNVKIGRKMIQALSEWALRKGIAENQKEAVSIAWGIARNMKRRGIFNRNGKDGLGILKELITSGRMKRIIDEELKEAIWRAFE